MTFLYPNFLYFLFTLSIPVIIHLFNFRKYKRIQFTNVQLLRDIEVKTRSVKKLKNLLILLSRLLALSMIIFAFAQPSFSDGTKALAPSAELSIIYLDNSTSMSMGSTGNSSFELAQSEAGQLLESISSGGFVIMSNDFDAASARVVSKKEAMDRLEKLGLSTSSRNISEIIQRIHSIETDAKSMSLYLFSDFQRSQFTDDIPQADSGLHTYLIQVRGEFTENVSIDTCWSVQGKSSIAGIDSIYFRISNYSDREISSLPVKLHVNSNQVSMTAVNVGPWSAITASLPFDVGGLGHFDSRLSTSDEGLFEDNDLYFSFDTDSAKRVYFLGNDKLLPYFQAVFKSPINFQNSSVRNVDIELLRKTDLFILDGNEGASTSLLGELKNRVNAGANLILFCSDSSGRSNMNSALNVLNLDALGPFNDQKVQASALNMHSAIISSAIDKIPENPDLPSAKGYFELKAKSKVAKENLLLLPGGKSMLTKYKVGNGYVFLYSIGFDSKYSNMLRHPLFVPLCINMAYSETADQQLYYYLNDNNLIPLSEFEGNNEILRIRGNHIEVIPENRRVGNTAYVSVHDQEMSAGNYGVFQAEERLTSFSLNYTRKESDPRVLNSAELEKLGEEISPGQSQVTESKSGTSVQKQLSESGSQNLWKYCVILALMFFVAEVLIIKLYKA